MSDPLQKRTYTSFGVVFAIIVLLVAWFWPGLDDEAEAPAPTGPAASQPLIPASARTTSGMPPTAGLDPMSTHFDAARLFEIGYAGGLKLDADTRRRLDDVLSSLPENPGPADMERLERTLREGLPREDAEQALGLITDYRGYVTDVRHDLANNGIPSDRAAVDAMFGRLSATQNRRFDSETAQALFGEQMRDGRVVMEAALVSQDTALSWDQKKERLDALRAQLPASKQNSIVDPLKGEAEGAAASAPE
jgi:hypothetical protein